jgi:hypothetical protein
MREYIFHVYILQSASRRALYIGMTNNLRRRVFQHKTHQFEGFTGDYNAIRLVYWEKFGSVGKAMANIPPKPKSGLNGPPVLDLSFNLKLHAEASIYVTRRPDGREAEQYDLPLV